MCHVMRFTGREVAAIVRGAVAVAGDRRAMNKAVRVAVLKYATLKAVLGELAAVVRVGEVELSRPQMKALKAVLYCAPAVVEMNPVLAQWPADWVDGWH